MFVERITKDQMKMFLETFACCSEQKNLVMRLNYAGKEPYLDVTRFSNGLVYTDSYYDFDSTYCSNLWNKFLYTQFTHEYYTAFKEYLMKDVKKADKYDKDITDWWRHIYYEFSDFQEN